MRICSVATPAAAEDGRLMAARLHRLLDLGWDARLLCGGERWAREPAIRDPRLAPRVELLPERDLYFPPGSLFRRPAGMVRYLRTPGNTGPFDNRLLALRPDLIHFHSAEVARRTIRVKRVLGCRVVVAFRSDGGDLDQPLPEMLWTDADQLLFPDSQMRDRAIARGCPPRRAEVLPVPRADQQTLTGRRTPSERLRVLSVGPLSWEQGLEHSVGAIRILLDMGVKCSYRIVGEGALLDAVSFARHQYGLGDVVEVVRLDDAGSMVAELLAADVLLDPAVTSTTSSTPLRTAAALGVPFVATRRGGLPEDAGLVVRRRDPREIAEALRKLAADAGLRARMGAAGRAQPDGQPTVEEHLRHLEDLYRVAVALPRDPERGA